MRALAAKGYGASLFALILCLCVALFWEPANYAAGVFALFCLVCGIIAAVQRTTRAVAILLATAGLGLAVTAALVGGWAPTLGVLGQMNQELAGMTASVVFLRLVVPVVPPRESSTIGVRALARTAVVTHLLGSALNVLAVGIIADQLKQSRRLAFADAALLARSYALGAFWSPFWVATAAASSFVPGGDPILHLLLGIGLSAVALVVSTWRNASKRSRESLASYYGYQISWRLVAIPVILAAIVVAARLLLPDASIPRLVVVSVVLVTFLGLLPKVRHQAPGVLTRHALAQLPGTRTEGTLFIGAGMLTMGFTAIQQVADFQVALPGFTPWVGWIMIILTVAVSLAGVHPVISIAIMAGLVQGLHPDPTLFMLAATVAWGLAAPVGPISGLTNYMAGQYGVSNLRLVRANLVVSLAMIPLALPLLYLCAWITAQR